MTIEILILALGLGATPAPSVVAPPATTPAAEASDSIAGIPREVVTQPIPLREDLARVSHPVATDSPEAREYHEQGLTYLHLYGGIEAARSFHAALERDPDLAPAHLGLALAYQRLGDREATLEAVERAEELALHAPDDDQAFVELRAHAIRERSALRQDEEKLQRFAERLDEAVEAHPGSVELRVFRAQMKSGQEEVEAYRKVLERAPGHVGVHHYLVHRFEGSDESVPLAVAHGRVLGALAPASAHGRHMYGHNLRKVGRVDEAIREFEAADSIERHLDREEGVPVEHDWHHRHNLALLGMSYLHQGRLNEAEDTFHRLASLPTSSPRREAMQWLNLADFHLTRGRWDGALEAARRIGDLDQADAQVLAALLEAVAHAGRGDLHAAEEARERAGDPKDGHPALVGFHRRLLTAFLGSNDGDDAAHTGEEPLHVDDGLLKEILEDLKGQQGPDSWARSHVRMEGIARLAYAHGLDGVVAKVAAAMRNHDGTYAGGHYWSVRADLLRGESPDPEDVAKALALWEHADASLPERAFLTERAADLEP